MIARLSELLALLTRDQKRRLIRLQALVLLMSIGEIAGVMAIGPFMAAIADPSAIGDSGLERDFVDWSGVQNSHSLVILFGAAVLCVLTVSSAISMLTTWKLSRFGVTVGGEISSDLFAYYMRESWLFHANGSSSTLTNRIAQECQRATVGILGPLMQMNGKAGVGIMLALAIFIYNPVVALIGVMIFALAYALLFMTVRRQLVRNGSAISRTQRVRFRLLAEGFGGIKDALVLGRQDTIIGRFRGATREFALAMGTNQALAQVPRYAMELVAYGSLISLVLYLAASSNGDLSTILPALSVYALAGFKMLPAFQQIYTSLSQMRGNISAYESIREDLVRARRTSLRRNDEMGTAQVGTPTERSFIHQHVQLNSVGFAYPGKRGAPALKDVNLTIGARETIGIVGASGSGKSTLIDVLLGLIEPESGELVVDGTPVDRDNVRAWQDALGFVPQSIFLADSSIRENIAFGLPVDRIDDDKVQHAAYLAHLEELIERLPDGLDTAVGERGVQISGGQRQRIGIARALYNDAEMLILDEATSALDGLTEKAVMDAIHDFAGKKTIVLIAHRLATVRECDRIFVMDNGSVVDQGSYDELMDRNSDFKKMAAHA